MKPQVLIVGAGAVGQAFALHLARGGCELAFLVKPQHSLDPSLRLFSHRRGAETLSGFQRLSTDSEVAARPWDQVWLAVPSDALDGGWLPRLLAATGTATVVALGPEGQSRIPADRLVVGAIPFAAWQQPLPGEDAERGIAWWVPPGARVPLSGDEARVGPIFQALKAGGLPAQRVVDAAATGAPVTALLIPMVAGLELAGWSISSFRGAVASLAAASAREAFRISEARGPLLWLARGWVLRAVLRLGSRFLPFNFESYLRYHFTKVGSQTRALLDAWVARANARHLPASSVEQLRRQLGD